MALTGVFSIFLSSFIRKVGTRRALPLGVIIYAVGIRFRWYDQSLLAGVLSGLLGGVGASFVLLSIRVRARLYQADKISPKFIAARKTVGDVASGLAGFLIAGMISYFGFRAAVFCALLPLAIALLLGLKKGRISYPSGLREGRLAHARSLGESSAPKPALSQFNWWSLLKPERSLSSDARPGPGHVGWKNSSSRISRNNYRSFYAAPCGLSFQKEGILFSFVVGEFIYVASLVTLITAHQTWIVPILVIVRVLGRLISGLAEEIIELSALSGVDAAAFYGAIQTTFLIGDSIGGAAGGLMVAAYGLRSPFYFTISLVAVHVLGMTFNLRKRHALDESSAAA